MLKLSHTLWGTLHHQQPFNPSLFYQRKKAIVAVARQRAVHLWRLHTGQCSAGQLGLTL
ncbi:MAG: hypothetical protein ABIT76_15270 [Chthoniobacterales bacterium]